jgi:hypothetical protein
MDKRNVYRSSRDAFGSEVRKPIARHQDGSLNQLGESQNFVDAFQKEYGLGRENWAENRRRVRKAENKAENAPRIVEMIESHPGVIRTMENLGLTKPGANEVRESMGMGLEPKGKGRRAGQILGAMAGDITQDTSRGFYWLLNALQATGSVATELSYGTRHPELFGVSRTLDDLGNQIVKSPKTDNLARSLGLIDDAGETRRGVRLQRSRDSEDYYYVKQNYAPGDVNSLLIPTGIAINSGLGLLSPFGGAEGYEAAVPSQDDKSKTENIVAEVGSKYIMGRTGGLLPYDEFKKVRPDISKGEYNAYKAFKYDKAMDFDPSDGKLSLAPGGSLKFTDDGIHGPEMQFLGRSLPVTTGLLPFATALAGTSIGVGTATSRKRPIRSGLIGGMVGLAGGQIGGNIIEGERRRRNEASNQAYYDGLDKITKEPGIQ